MAMNGLKKAGAGIGIAAIFGAAVFGIVTLNDAVHSKESGAEFLRSKGYTNVTGGAADFFNSCGEDTYARSFEVTNKQGKRTSATVCYGLWKYEALF